VRDAGRERKTESARVSASLGVLLLRVMMTPRVVGFGRAGSFIGLALLVVVLAVAVRGQSSQLTKTLDNILGKDYDT